MSNWKPGEPIWDLQAIKNELANEEPEINYEDEFEKRVYLGSCLNLYPSGKYYMPFACSNVDACPQCKGSGNVNAHPKKRIRKKAFARYNKLISTSNYLEKHPRNQKNRNRLGRIWSKAQKLAFGHMCPMCEGLGSYEAFLDECWREQAESELSSIGCYMTSGEGDACDLIAVQPVDE